MIHSMVLSVCVFFLLLTSSAFFIQYYYFQLLGTREGAGPHELTHSSHDTIPITINKQTCHKYKDTSSSHVRTYIGT